jgi:hypothetical protein
MYIVTLAEAKKHLNLESYFTEDDTYITNLISVAFYAIKNKCNNIYWEDTSGSTEGSINPPDYDYSISGTTIPIAVKQAILLIVGNFYANREPVSFGNPVIIPYTIEFLLQPYIKYQ